MLEKKSSLTDLLMWFLCARVFWRVVFGCQSSADSWQKSFSQPVCVLVTQPWFPQVQQYQQTLLQQQMLAQQRAQQVQSPEYITSPQDLAPPALISYPRSLPVHGGRVADPPYPTNRWELWLSWAWELLVAYITNFVVSTARSFSQKLLALVVRDYLELVSECSVIKGYFGSKVRIFVNRWAWYNFLEYLSSSISCSWTYSRNWLLTSLGVVSSLCWIALCASERSFKHPVKSSFVVGLDVLGLPTPVLRARNMMYTSEEIRSLSSGLRPAFA